LLSFQFVVKVGKHQNSDVHKTNLTKMVAYKIAKQSDSIMAKLWQSSRGK